MDANKPDPLTGSAVQSPPRRRALGAGSVAVVVCLAATLWVFDPGAEIASVAPHVLAVAAVGMILEAVSVRGLDNLTISLGVLGVLALIQTGV